MTISPPVLFDRALMLRRLPRAGAVAGGDFLHRRAAEDAVQSLEAIQRRFEHVLDLSARSGLLQEALRQSPASSRWGPVQSAPFPADEQLPQPPQSADLITSFLDLHSVNDLPGAFIQIRRTLRPGGVFLGSVFGGETLRELREVLLEAEIEVRGGAGPRVFPFAEPPSLLDLMKRAGFAEPVIDVDRMTVRYGDIVSLMRDLRAMGQSNVLIDRPRRPLSKAVLLRANALYADRYADADGRLRARFDIVNLSGWAMVPPQDKGPTSAPPVSGQC